MTEEEYNLSESVGKLGRLVPIIKDAHGNIIDGFHRQQLDPKWEEEFSIKLDNITDPVQLLLARMNINTHRRIVSAEEKTQWLTELKKLTNWTPREIAESSGWSERTIYRYLPQELKQPVPIGLKTESASVAPEKIPEIPKQPQIEEQKLRPVVEAIRKGTCIHCSLDTNFIKEWQGNLVCTLCYEKLQRGEIALEQLQTKLKEPPSLKDTGPLRSNIKVKDTWEQRKATMQVPMSKIEEAVLSKLAQKDLHPEVQREFCLRSTRPDYYFPQQNLAIYLDGEVHQGREDRDEAIRELLTKRHGVRVISIAYEGSSEVTEDSIVKQIMETIK